MNLIGIALVIVGPIMLARRRMAVRAAGQAKGLGTDYAAGTFWGAVCALGYGTSPLFVALGTGDGGNR